MARKAPVRRRSECWAGGRPVRLSVRIPLLGLMVLVGGLVVPLHAQTTSTIQGTVTDQQGLALPDAEITVRQTATGAQWTATSDSRGFYRVVGLAAGSYELTAERSGFAGRTYRDLEVALNRTLVIDIRLEVGAVEQAVTVEASVPLIDATVSHLGTTIAPRQITEMPLNGRNYLDLMQLVPGVTINRQANEGSDLATPVLGERAGNTLFLIDGMPNSDEFGGGSGAQFNQDTIREFEVLTSGFKAEFGHGSAGIVNVITKSGSNTWSGSGFGFHRNSEVDRSNSLDPATREAPSLVRWDFGATLGGPIAKDRAFVFGSAERLRESRQLNFSSPAGTPQVLRDFENAFNDRTRTFDTRLFLKLEEHVGPHLLSQQVNVTNGQVTDFLPLTAATSFPSTRRDLDSRTTMLGFRDTTLLGGGSNPWLLTAYLQYREEPSENRPSHPEAGPQTRWFGFSRIGSGSLFGDRGLFQFGTGDTAGEIDPKYLASGGNLAKTLGRHNVKVGAEFLRTKVDGVEAQNLDTQLFATEGNFLRFGPIFSGFFSTTTTGGLTPEDNLLRLRNNYVGLYAQDDWRILDNLTLNLGVRWDYDSEFKATDNVAPRVGAVWSLTPKTVVRGSFGVFYDRFRLGLVRRVPEFGGASFRRIQPASYPQLLYNLTTIAPLVVGICVDPVRTTAQIPAGQPCPFNPTLPLLGVDRLNTLGPIPISPETVVTRDNAQALSGLSPDEFLAAANAALPVVTGKWFWGPFGVLSHPFLGGPQPITLDPAFKTPFTRSASVGVQWELASDLVVSLDYIHKDIKNILGVRNTNVAFIARIPGRAGTFDPPVTGTFVHAFGPWYEGDFDALVASVLKRFGRRFTVEASYTFADAVDNLLNPNLGSGAAIFAFPTDSFVGVPPVVTDPRTGQTNANGSFTASNGNFVPQAGVFWNGPDVDRGKSDLAVDHMLLLHGLAELPGNFHVSGIFRAQRGFRFSRQAEQLADPDGNNAFSVRDLSLPRNSFKAPPYVNLDLRVSKRLPLRGQSRATLLVEFFNLFNRQNPAAVETARGRPTAFSQPLQVLPGMETQVGVRIEF